MIHGCASIESTKAWLNHFGFAANGPLGRTQLTVSHAGFGCYRVSTGISEHARALLHALASGINLIDTSANYADGGSEELVGQVIDHLVESGEMRRDSVVVVSKAGYLQGQNYALSQERKRRGEPFPDLVLYGEGLEHCIHPEFLQDQLTRSLERLRLQTLDVLLLHNPEYYLGWALKHGVSADHAQAEYYLRIENAFRYLETEAAGGRIRWYGISSNTFPAASSDPQFTCLERVWTIAESISKEHHFGIVQMPMNLFETGAVLTANQPSGATALEFARRQNLGVLINRPLNAFAEGRLIRLSEVTEAGDFAPEEIPSALAAADPDWGGEAPLSRLAVRALRSTEGISCVLVGMRRPVYVDDVLAELKTQVARKNRRDSWLKLEQRSGR
jgi:hypothetical protein